METDNKVFLALCLSVLAFGAGADTVNALAPYDNAQNTAFWNTTGRATDVNASAQSSASVTLAGTGGGAGTLAVAFDPRPGTSATSAPRSLRTTKGKGITFNFR